MLALALGTDDLAATAAVLRAAGIATADPVELRVDEPTGERRARLLAIASDATRGVNVFGVAHDRGAIARAPPLGDERAAVAAVDHVVLFSDDADATLAVWRDAFAIPERWRREFADRGTLNVGLRLGGVTIEIVAPLGATADGRRDRLWGLAFAVPDCDRAVTRMRAASVPVTDVRAGLAPATHVATVKRPDGVPTLLIEHVR